ncbi:uncharacterized protein LOC107433718 [Ziziphus jujuba]|uniref:Uncharacterized protein LOC107433718 n=2 Tax=Ziziphus jujuba TaxID=326968 RepID=A0A6P3Z6F8_ZIZJJ|nr:uncharacterized protein LOC107433718 [Ziziphus jujuba]KAH7523734.1 hypothetical protein FEM48_Zijuj06G0043400 [Ziziphus jujuba var. spinosa]
MLIPFICGTLHHEEEDDHTMSSSACSTPKKSRKNGLFSKNKDNPYSSRGLDKFSALLADLEEKRQKIYAESGAQDISLVRFVYKNSNDCVPIVIKLKDKKDEKTMTEEQHATEQVLPDDKFPIETSMAVKEENQSKLESDKYTKNKRSFSWNNTKFAGWKWNRPSFYLPVFVILILLFLALFGRSIAILCTSIGWYMVPTLKESSDRRRSMKKKEYVRKLSQPKMKTDGLSSPKTNRSEGVKDKSPRQHGHRKSW